MISYKATLIPELDPWAEMDIDSKFVLDKIIWLFMTGRAFLKEKC